MTNKVHLRDTPIVCTELLPAERGQLLRAIASPPDAASMLIQDYVHPRDDLLLEALQSRIKSGDRVELTNEEANALKVILSQGHMKCRFPGLYKSIRDATENISTDPLPTAGSQNRGSNWGSVREKVIAAADRECQRCGKSEAENEDLSGKSLHVHHIIPYRRFNTTQEANSLWNLQALCSGCHQKVEAESVDVDSVVVD